MAKRKKSSRKRASSRRKSPKRKSAGRRPAKKKSSKRLLKTRKPSRSQKKKVLILGGRGFVGSALQEQLKGFEVYTYDRNFGGDHHFRGSVLNIAELKQAFLGMDVVVNLVGLTPTRRPRGPGYYDIHVKGMSNIIDAAKFCKIPLVVHQGALGADLSSKNSYFRTKAQAIELLASSKLHFVVLNPSLILDKDNELVKQLSFASAFRCFPRLMTNIQPIYRQDVSKILSLAVQGKIKKGIYSIAGPDQISFYHLAKKIYFQKNRLCFPVPSFLFKIAVLFGGVLRIHGLSIDQFRLLNKNNVTSANDAEKFINLTPLDVMLARI